MTKANYRRKALFWLMVLRDEPVQAGRHSSKWEEWSQQQEAERSHCQGNSNAGSKVDAERALNPQGLTPEMYFLQHGCTSWSAATAPPTGDQVFEHGRLRRTFLNSITQVYPVTPYKNSTPVTVENVKVSVSHGSPCMQPVPQEAILGVSFEPENTNSYKDPIWKK